MQKTTFKIATKFERNSNGEPLKPIEYTEVEGFTIGNWGIVESDKYCTIYHTVKGLRLSFYYFTEDNAIKALKKAVEMFGENNNGEPTPDNQKLLNRWEFETFELMPDDEPENDDDDDF